MKYTISEAEEWEHFLKLMDVVVPPRAEGRTKQHTEQWTAHKLFCFLSSNLHRFGVSYPLNIEFGDRPDISIHTIGCSFGIEHTEVVQPDYARAVAIAKQENIEGVIDKAFFRWRQRELSLDEIRSIVSRKSLSGHPLVGDAVEKEFSLAVSDALLSKDERLKQPGFKRHGKDWLLMYYNHISWGIDCELAAMYTSNKLASYWGHGFDRVLVVIHDNIIGFEPNHFHIYRLL